MKEFTAVLCHARRFKSAVKELSVEQLEEVKQKLDKIIEEKTIEFEKLREGEAERLEVIKEIQEMLVAKGIEPSELQFSTPVKKGKRPPRQPKYEIVNEAGDRITWTGQGRMPNIFKSRIEQGDKMEKFLIGA
ncbi:MAG: DNA-binding protein H-NS [Desulforhopalus sp.]|jgi:DNA-binding protein H-NS